MGDLVALFVRGLVRWMPDAFSVTVLLTILTWLLGRWCMNRRVDSVNHPDLDCPMAEWATFSA